MLVVHATIPIDPDSREEALDHVTRLAEQSREEDGVVDYRVTTDIESPNQLRIFEQYEDAAAFGAHAQSDHFTEFLGALPEFLDGETTVRQFEVESATEVDL